MAGISTKLRAIVVLVCCATLGLSGPLLAKTGGSSANSTGDLTASQLISRMSTQERYAPTIWVDPDGCEHWVMDDGVEGYMTPNVNRQGIPVCRRQESCAVMNADQFFATDRYNINPANQQRLANFFASAGATSYIIIGHTDSRASDAYNMRLSYNRANAVAQVAARTGARIADVRGMGERSPRASNATRAGMAQNRRVEIICIR